MPASPHTYVLELTHPIVLLLAYEFDIGAYLFDPASPHKYVLDPVHPMTLLVTCELDIGE